MPHGHLPSAELRERTSRNPRRRKTPANLAADFVGAGRIGAVGAVNHHQINLAATVREDSESAQGLAFNLQSQLGHG